MTGFRDVVRPVRGFRGIIVASAAQGPAPPASDQVAQRMPTIFGFAGEAIAAGMPVARSRVDDRLLCARADAHALAFLAGLATADTVTAAPLEALRSSITLTNWTAVAGTPALTIGQPYFLAPAGGVTLTPPAKPDSVCNVRVGEALTPQTLVFGYSAPILL